MMSKLVGPVDSETWQEYIPNWPYFALDQSEDLQEIVQRELGVITNQKLKLWSDAEDDWVSLNPIPTASL